MLELPDSTGDQVMMAVEPPSAQPQIEDDNIEDIDDMVTSLLLYNSS